MPVVQTFRDIYFEKSIIFSNFPLELEVIQGYFSCITVLQAFPHYFHQNLQSSEISSDVLILFNMIVEIFENESSGICEFTLLLFMVEKVHENVLKCTVP